MAIRRPAGYFTVIQQNMNQTIPSNEDIIALFSKHFVPIHFYFLKGEKEHHAVISTFLISIRNAWFLITAGHCLRDVKDNIEKYGCILKKSQLIDYGGMNSRHRHGVPFDYESAPKLDVKDEKYDYGIIYLNTYYVDLLKKNNVVPLNEEVWEKQPRDPEFYFLLGVPGKLTEVHNDTITITTSINFVEKCEQKPEIFGKTEAPTFYGKISLDEKVQDIEGMSGGPIFSFKRTESGQLKYWLHAIQSRWIKRQKLIAACLANPFIAEIKKTMEEIEAKK
jgi:hypothetical protein